MKSKKQSMINTGLPSLLVIFIILCLVTFAVLSFVSALRDYSDALQASERLQSWYAADSSARVRLAEINGQLFDIYGQLPASGQDDFLEECRGSFPEMDADGVLSFSTDFSDSQMLLAEIQVTPPAPGEDICYKIRRWQVVTTAEWNADDSLPVLQ